MNSSAKPVPSKHYRKRQRELQRLLDLPGGAGRNAASSIEEELEAQFALAWGFSDDTDGQASEMKMMAARICGTLDRYFDHCTCYYQPQTNSHIVVTQPYFEPDEVVASLAPTLAASHGIKPDIIPAPEWAFYYPGHATLIIVSFPPGCETVLKALDRLWSPAAERNLPKN